MTKKQKAELNRIDKDCEAIQQDVITLTNLIKEGKISEQDVLELLTLYQQQVRLLKKQKNNLKRNIKFGKVIKKLWQLFTLKTRF
jgi:hypothetical protein